jgi:hypothetical protein
MKFLIIEEERHTRQLYPLTRKFLLTNKAETFICFLLMTLAFAGATVAAYFLMGSRLHFLVSYALSIFLLSYTTALLKVTSFIFYLLIRNR